MQPEISIVYLTNRLQNYLWMEQPRGASYFSSRKYYFLNCLSILKEQVSLVTFQNGKFKKYIPYQKYINMHDNRQIIPVLKIFDQFLGIKMLQFAEIQLQMIFMESIIKLFLINFFETSQISNFMYNILIPHQFQSSVLKICYHKNNGSVYQKQKVFIQNPIQHQKQKQLVKDKLTKIKRQLLFKKELLFNQRQNNLQVITKRYNIYQDIFYKMKSLQSLAQMKNYTAKVLSQAQHKTYSSTLESFKYYQDKNKLMHTYTFNPADHENILLRMQQIGYLAQEIQHHPQWFLKPQSLQIHLSTHDIGNKVSIKDYVLATWIESIWKQPSIGEQMLNQWNKKNLIIQ